MKPEEKAQFEELQKRVTAIENGQSLQTYNNLIRQFVKDKPTVTDADVDTSLVVPMGGGTFQILDFPDRWVRVILDGKVYRLGAWLEENDAART